MPPRQPLITSQLVTRKLEASGRTCTRGILGQLPHVVIGTTRKFSLVYLEAFIASGRGPVNRRSIAAFVQSQRGLDILSSAKAELLRLIDQIAQENGPSSPKGYLSANEVAFVLGFATSPGGSQGLEKHFIEGRAYFRPDDVIGLISWSA